MRLDNAAALAKRLQLRLQALPLANTAALRMLRRDFSRLLVNAPAQAMLELARHLLRTGSIACRFLAYELIHYHPSALSSVRQKELTELGRGIDSWGAVDMFGAFLAGPAWREGQVPDRLIHRWARSPDRWWRRAALVATVPLNNKTRGGTGDARRTLALCRLLVADRDDMVVKALSWALRELAKRDAKAVERFLAEQEKELAPRVRREVRSKLTTGLKNPRRT